MHWLQFVPTDTKRERDQELVEEDKENKYSCLVFGAL